LTPDFADGKVSAHQENAMAAIYIPPIVVAALAVSFGIGYLIMKALGAEDLTDRERGQ
jgi:hypothetical protein